MENQLPKKINPDYIIDSIVQIKFIPKVHSKAVFGIIYECIDDTYTINEGIVTPNSNNFELALKIEAVPEFFNDKIRIQIEPYSLVFNIRAGVKYIGWNSYFLEIKKFLDQIKLEKLFFMIDFIGIRYISEYQNRDLKEIVNFNFGFGLPSITSKTYSFKTEFDFEDTRVILNLHNKLPVNTITNDIIQNNIFKSHLDIDVNMRKEIKGDEMSYVLEAIDYLHTTEKKVFWSIVNDAYKKEIEITY